MGKSPTTCFYREAGGNCDEKTPLSDEQASKFYQEYLRTLSAEDAELLEMVFAHEYLFADMCLEANSVVHDFVAYQIETDDGKFMEASDDHYLSLDSQKWRFYVRNLNSTNASGITNAGGSHDVLFFLKSLDLDLKLGFKLGTVCGYGRDL